MAVWRVPRLSQGRGVVGRHLYIDRLGGVRLHQGGAGAGAGTGTGTGSENLSFWGVEESCCTDFDFNFSSISASVETEQIFVELSSGNMIFSLSVCVETGLERIGEGVGLSIADLEVEFSDLFSRGFTKSRKIGE